MNRISIFLNRLSAVVLLSLWMLPSGAQAAEAAMKTRGNFIQDAVNTFNISPIHTGTLPYKRVPSIQKPYIQAAYNKGALQIFGDDLQAGRAITRGEAAQVIVILGNIAPTSAEKSFSDVKKGTDLSKAVTVLVEKQWLKPVRRNRFGADQPLTVTESRLLLQRIERSLKEAGEDRIKVNIPKTPVQTEQTKILNAVWELLEKEYLYEDRLDSKKAVNSATDALVKTLNDPYTVYFPPVENKQFQEQISGEVTGIGVQVEQNAMGLLVVAPLPGSPAEKAGVQAGDIIIAVDGVSLQGVAYLDAIAKVRGQKGSQVTIRVRRNGAELDYSMKRDTVKVPEITVTTQGDVSIIKISQFGETTDREIRSIYSKIKESNPSGIIIDLRNNPGGLLHAADVVMGGFIPANSVIAQIHTKDGIYKEMSEGNPIFASDLPVMILVNKGSASASEIVAGAFQDLKRGTVVGETTFGKGTVQQIVEFKDGSSLKMTIAEWKTPLDRKIDGIGVQPDFIVNSASEPDAALKKALELLY